MIKTLLALSTAALVATSPVAARAKAEPAPAPTEAPVKAEKASQRYCVVGDITGSRIPHRTCMTRDQWLAEGFDPAAK